jgi:hypothetical protein
MSDPSSASGASPSDEADDAAPAADDAPVGPGPVWDPDLDSPLRTVLCPLCSELFSDPKELQAHLADVHRFGNKKKVRTKVVATTKPGATHYTRKRERLTFFSGNFAPLLAGIVVLIVVIGLVYPKSIFVTIPVGLGLLLIIRTGVFRR